MGKNGLAIGDRTIATDRPARDGREGFVTHVFTETQTISYLPFFIGAGRGGREGFHTNLLGEDSGGTGSQQEHHMTNMRPMAQGFPVVMFVVNLFNLDEEYLSGL